ncbi:nucleoside hydrolase [Methylorubrum thiocyanatum]|uniref:Inosine-uridine nucleoside N-ribohydrolase n=1 Tax=Methylorubrum thiocyanatum TaxID=47958 RepID=A0AA40S6A2_9HYPH|nr:nucleoside hydrolase [Methylorubrum thiocyanatum]MBA8915386.1 inosine-uridine nucleoside N-ribohydrolase [Methylorubrum thiocyanatum]GJE81314.1 Non-specific ribonucleoside hydrolase RihC [Methylorubrum thiocyanatum]
MAIERISNLFNFFDRRPEVIIDTDIGDDIDDAFAIVWALVSRRLTVRAILTAHGDTELRAALTRKLLRSYGKQEIPVWAGVATQTDVIFTQKDYAGEERSPSSVDGIHATLDLIRKRPNRLTLIALAPLHNIGAMIDRDPATFKTLKRVIVMGGSLRRGYNSPAGEPNLSPQAEHNIHLNPGAFDRLLQSGVPIVMMPLDSVQARPSGAFLHAVGEAHPDLHRLLTLWQHNNPFQVTRPTLFDVVAMAAAITPQRCPLIPLRVGVDAIGMTTESEGAANVRACLATDHEEALGAFMRDLCPSYSGPSALALR